MLRDSTAEQPQQPPHHSSDTVSTHTPSAPPTPPAQPKNRRLSLDLEQAIHDLNHNHHNNGDVTPTFPRFSRSRVSGHASQPLTLSNVMHTVASRVSRRSSLSSFMSTDHRPARSTISPVSPPRRNGSTASISPSPPTMHSKSDLKQQRKATTSSSTQRVAAATESFNQLTLAFQIPVLEYKFLRWYTSNTGKQLMRATREQALVQLLAASPLLPHVKKSSSVALYILIILLPVLLFALAVWKWRRDRFELIRPKFLQWLIVVHVFACTLCHMIPAITDNEVRTSSQTPLMFALLCLFGVHLRLRFCYQIVLSFLQFCLFIGFAAQNHETAHEAVRNTLTIFGALVLILSYSRDSELRVRADFKNSSDLHTQQNMLQSRVDVFKKHLGGRQDSKFTTDPFLSPLEKSIILLKRLRDAPGTSPKTKSDMDRVITLLAHIDSTQPTLLSSPTPDDDSEATTPRFDANGNRIPSQPSEDPEDQIDRTTQMWLQREMMLPAQKKRIISTHTPSPASPRDPGVVVPPKLGRRPSRFSSMLKRKPNTLQRGEVGDGHNAGDGGMDLSSKARISRWLHGGLTSRPSNEHATDSDGFSKPVKLSHRRSISVGLTRKQTQQQQQPQQPPQSQSQPQPQPQVAPPPDPDPPSAPVPPLPAIMPLKQPISPSSSNSSTSTISSTNTFSSFSSGSSQFVPPTPRKSASGSFSAANPPSQQQQQQQQQPSPSKPSVPPVPPIPQTHKGTNVSVDSWRKLSTGQRLPGLASGVDAYPEHMLEPDTLSRISTLLERIDEWNFPIFELDDLTQQHPLYFMSIAIFERRGFFEAFSLDRTLFRNFVLVIEANYQPNPYHNAIHAADVLQTNHYFLLRALDGKAYDFYIFCSCFAAIVHDYEHNGVNNDFLIRSEDPRAMVYNDRSPQENHHIAAAFACLTQPQNNFIHRLTPERRRDIRRVLVELVLATDISQHSSILSTFRIKLNSGGLEQEDEDTVLLILKMTLKCADISHTAKEDFLHSNWTERVTDEFFLQGDLERQCGLPVSPFMDRHNAEIGKSQLGFFQYIVQPLFDTYHQWLAVPDAPYMTHLRQHRQKYERIKEMEQNGESTGFV